MSYICVKAQLAIATGELTFEKKPLSTSNCPYEYSPAATNTSIFNDPVIKSSSVGSQIYHISYLWYTFFGALISIIIALAVSYVTGFNRLSDMDPNLVAPFLRKYIKKSKPQFANNQVKNVTTLSLDIKKAEERF